MKKIIPQSLKNIYHLFQAIFANVWYGFPSRRLLVIGVTGTNGKTTTTQMIAKVLEESGFKIAVVSTINFKIAEKEWVNKSKFTTLSSFAVQKFLKQAVGAGCEYAVLEISSHSLDQNRVWGTDFDVAVITNVTREHLDYHETMEEYAKVKGRLFSGLGRCGKLGESVAIVNLGMEFADNFLKYDADERYGYILETQNAKRKTQNHSAKLKTVVAEQIELEINYSKFQISNFKFQIFLPGEFNIENALAATCVGLSQNIPLEKISAALAKIKGVPGRMEKIENNRNLEIIVDYAVTPDSLEKLYDYLNGIRKEGSKIIAVFGSCGERDRGKRPIMGEIVARHADYCIVTNEDPYHEDPQQIIDEVFAGVVGRDFPKARLFPSSSEALKIPQSQALENTKTEGVDAFRMLDRREAIKTALQIAKPGDIVVVTGKGAEEMMAVGDKMVPWNDPKVIREILAEL
ncbi:MAG: UDP-N-acetylmuramoyl-L-alanyl-D-glutamate--2,6-diaminopimelate ligase [Candidatus Moranbacteria bacterium]|nr:UDP-N-acetylmuramoyl-L-alanyl-D-glutamate--2,6-diaminopimelate ligase [Candidatus Moranbacteria bacterium]